MNWHIGTSGFQFEDWIGTVYPSELGKGDLFDYYCRTLGLDCVELNATFYTIPGFKSIGRLIEKSPEGFKFAVKVHGSITHERRLDELEKFLDISRLFMEQGKLLCFLAQFPYSFKYTPESVAYLLTLKEKFPYFDRLYIEIRHDSWRQFARSTSDFKFVLVDLPPLPKLPQYSDWIRIFREKTHKLLYFRLHGRNRNWYEADEKTRYDYYYSKDELSLFLQDIKEINAEEVCVFFNNCYVGKALRNALELRLMLKD